MSETKSERSEQSIVTTRVLFERGLLPLSCSTFHTFDHPRCLSLSPDGSVVTLVKDNEVHLVSTRSGDTLRVFKGNKYHIKWITRAEWSPDGRFIATASLDDNLRFWDPVSGKVIKSFWVSQCLSIRWSPDSTRVMIRCKFGVRLIAIGTWVVKSVVRSRKYSIFHSITWSPDGERALIMGTSPGERAFMCTVGDPLRLKPMKDLISACGYNWSSAWSPRGPFVAIGLEDGSIGVYDVESESKLFGVNEPDSDEWVNSTTCSLSWSPDGNILASATSNGVIRLWDAKTGALIKQLSGRYSGSYISCGTRVVFSRDGSSLVTNSMEGAIKVWHF